MHHSPDPLDNFNRQAIHDLSIHELSIFLPATTELFPSILDNLLAPRLALLAQACHALSGSALGASQIPLSHAHTWKLSSRHLQLIPTTSSPSTPSASKSELMLIKTLRTTLASHDPTCAAQGSVWALCTLAAVIVLLGPALVTSTEDRQGAPRPLHTSQKVILDIGDGVNTVGALLAHKSDDAHRVSRAIALLESMVQRGGNMCHEAVQTLCRLVSTQCDTVPSPQVKDNQEAEMNGDGDDSDWRKLLPKGLFSADPGLLTVDFASLSEEVHQVLKQTSTWAGVCALNAVELWMPGAMDGLIKVWRTALTQPELVQSWKGLLKAALRGLQSSPDASDEEDGQEGGLVRKLAELAVSLMQDILGDPKVQLVLSGDPETPSQNRVRGTPSEALLTWLMEREPELVWETDTPHDARTQWAMLCAEVLLRTSVAGSTLAPALLRMIWVTPSASRRWVWSWETDVRARVWRVFVERWRMLAEGWEEALVLLSVPFWKASPSLFVLDKDGWEMNTEDLDAWDATLQVCLARALDDGGDTTRMLDHLASTIASTHITYPDRLVGDARRRAPAWSRRGANRRPGTAWIRERHTRAPSRSCARLSVPMQEGLSVWVADQYRVLTVEEYTFDVVPLYETIMVCLQSLGSSIDTLKSLGPLLEAGFIGREDKPQGIVDTFQDYWDLLDLRRSHCSEGWMAVTCDDLPQGVREVHLIPAPLRAETTDRAFTWSSSSTIAVDEDDTSEPSQESNAFAFSTIEVELVSTPKAAPTIPLAPTKLDFVVGPVSPSSPSRPPRSPVHSPRKVSDSSDKESTPPIQGLLSPISVSLRKARVLFGSDDTMATDIDDRGGAAPPSCESSDDDDPLSATSHHITFSRQRRAACHGAFPPYTKRLDLSSSSFRFVCLWG
ncbi:hypothetical protein F5148DRAFT_1338704 [Russula earlei]|uniref:Uncharacterized protein n=1 Tax=Russula earlei TaxID=71964 RepID=A0ACC0TUS6_9AGAM|nr:hypothetical protein F5148DRAFT_1338704 [Russula earlei]